jgi:hypothetical protein
LCQVRPRLEPYELWFAVLVTAHPTAQRSIQNRER